MLSYLRALVPRALVPRALVPSYSRTFVLLLLLYLSPYVTDLSHYQFSVGILKTDALKLVIGAKNNTKTTIQSEDSGDVYLEIDTPNILDKDAIKDFWVSWNEGEVQFGKSNIPGFDRLLNFQVIPVLNIRAVRFSTDYGKDGQWMVQMWDEAK